MVGILTTKAQEKPYYKLQAFGNQTTGGLGGKIIKVTNTNSSGAGSLREALTASGTRLIVFEVGGVIDLGLKSITVSNPNVTIAGQTAPYPGITLIKGSVYINTHNVVMQHIAIRPGNASQLPGTWEPDGISTTGTETYNVVFDHCSATWAIDENLSVSGPGDSQPFASSRNITLYRCLIAEGLSNSTHSKGEHSKGTLLHDGVSNVAIIECLYAHNMQRNPLFKGNSSAFLANNIIYNSGNQCIGMSDIGTRSDSVIGRSRATIVGNLWMKGTNSTSSAFITGSGGRISGEVYTEGNILKNRWGGDEKERNNYVMKLEMPEIWPENFMVKDPRISVYEVLRTVGSRPAQRDSIDMRIVHSVLHDTGKIIDNQNEVGGYPVYAETKRTLTVPSSFAEQQTWLDSLSSALGTIQYEINTSRIEQYIGTPLHQSPNSLSGSLVKVFPIPCNELLYIQPLEPSKERFSVELFTHNGQKIHSLEIEPNTSSSFHIATDTLPPSVYFLKITGNGATQFQKVLRMN